MKNSELLKLNQNINKIGIVILILVIVGVVLSLVMQLIIARYSIESGFMVDVVNPLFLGSFTGLLGLLLLTLIHMLIMPIDILRSLVNYKGDLDNPVAPEVPLKDVLDKLMKAGDHAAVVHLIKTRYEFDIYSAQLKFFKDLNDRNQKLKIKNLSKSQEKFNIE